MANILYAEDDRDCRELFAFALRQKDHKVHEAINGAQAVQIVREEAIDLALLDVRMPMVTGYDTARIIAQEGIKTIREARKERKLTARKLAGRNRRC